MAEVDGASKSGLWGEGAWRLWAAVPLVALAGCVDAIGWLRLDELFVGFISGSSTLLGLAIVAGRADRAAALALVVGLFAAGALAGAAAGRAAGPRWRAPAVLVLVAALLALAWRLPLAGAAQGEMAMVPAMGAVNAAATGVGGITFVTGSLTRCAEALVAALAGSGPPLAWVPQLAAWAALVGGATLGAALEGRLGPQALAVPAAGAALAALVAAAAGAKRRSPTV